MGGAGIFGKQLIFLFWIFFMFSKNDLSEDVIRAIGRRKSSTAQVWFDMRGGGDGTMTVNGDPLYENYQQTKLHPVRAPFDVIRDMDPVDFNIHVKVDGGGHASQAAAIQLGIARALVILKPEARETLKAAGLLTRDSRIKERKKCGLKKARKASQFSKR